MELDDQVNLAEYVEWKKQVLHRQEVLQKISDRNNNVITQLLSENKPIKIELGAGKEHQLEGWTTIDISGDSDLILDLRNPLPFPDESVTEIYSSHVLEHFLYPYQMAGILNECYRILKKGGIFRVCVPNSRIYIEAYLNPDKFDAERYCQFKPAYHYKSPIDYINYIAYMAGHHYHLFDEDNLVSILSQAGFNNVRLRDFDPSIDLESRRYESIYAIAEKISTTSLIISELEVQLNLHEINYIVFPNWTQSEDELGLELQEIIKALANHPESEKITLLINTGNIDAEEATMFLSSIAMNLLMEEDLDISDSINIALVAELGDRQWESLLPRIYGRVVLKNEDELALAQAPVSKLKSYQIDSLIN
ncbi:class I SAM-dependent methyltransferase [Trichormus variabilis]|uniref:Methyltransferase type 11 domain-containing protein n=1 Tax=Trichormus variabilis SAG 1403-4b TaxID=447716 RepID=A0A433UTS8_ANAVA|nr:methyltransferase domain-containing protein [Trichormus variabilis]MBD2627873.1 methyltransferase domain-containing protein [Trichormus variabilis FACHB-164]RUS97253.1 hypothetical protein DSM107003_19940 [Trichormus variabilis SAG 1403-4b]